MPDFELEGWESLQLKGCGVQGCSGAADGGGARLVWTRAGAGPPYPKLCSFIVKDRIPDGPLTYLRTNQFFTFHFTTLSFSRSYTAACRKKNE